MYKQNLHTHTIYCDGADTPEEMVEAAIAQGFDSIGFSAHSFMPFSQYLGNRPDWTAPYFQHIQQLKQAYRGKLQIFTGLEVEMYSPPNDLPWDYRIGSVHYLFPNGEALGFDRGAEEVAALIRDHFDGDGMAYAKCYYETLSRLPERGHFDILGHPDLICKHRQRSFFFDPNSPDYRRWACDALDALVGQIPFFEVNTGAIARGYRTTPYPDPFLLDELKKRGFGAIISSDCHDRRQLSCHFEEAAKLLWDHGFRQIYILTEDGFRPEEL